MDNDEIKQKILGKVLMFLAYRVRTRKEVTQRLDKYLKSEKYVGDAVKEDITRQVLDYLEQNNLINDESFAKLYIESKTKGKSVLGKKAILVKLMERGISKNTANLYLNTNISEEDELNAAVKVLMNKYRTAAETREKMGRFLLSRGFSYPTAKHAVDYLLKRP